MKFEKYLREKETPEWKKAYINYRGLKKLVKQISRQSLWVQSSASSTAEPPSKVNSHAGERSLAGSPDSLSAATLPAEPINELGPEHRLFASITSLDPLIRKFSSDTKSCSSDTKSCSVSHLSEQPELSLDEILHQLTPKQRTFFDMLDEELKKVEDFYLRKEKEMEMLSCSLINQLRALEAHRIQTHTKKGWAASIVSIFSRILPQWAPSPQHERQNFKVEFPIAGEHSSWIDSESQSSGGSLAKNNNNKFMTVLLGPTTKQRQEKDNWNRKGERSYLTMSNDPGSYVCAQRKLKRAVVEHYRGLETLHKYLILNFTGFRKAVKKFEKITAIRVSQQYMAERVGSCAFASVEKVRHLTRRMEVVYADAFSVCGDKKAAIEQLRASRFSTSHHRSTFLSGLFIGLAILALIDGLVKVFQPETQHAIPYWNILLFLYGLILVPVLYSVLLGVNFLVWARSRINYKFVFDLDVTSNLDYQQYFETPSLLLGTLCLAFWSSFSRLGAPTVQPTTWPLAWLMFMALIMINPTPVMARSSRFWLIKTILKLFLSGFRSVEFVDFWLGDQFCSLIFTLSNVPLFVCVYIDNFSDNWQKCENSSRTWPIAFGLASIPLIIRLVQSVKRYFDSKLLTNLVNAGKYGAGIVNYLFYFMWSYQEASYGNIFVLWCAFNTFYSTYACSWDLLVDYSVLQPKSKHFLLRTELMYRRQWVYYLAMLSNLLVRFIWVIYIPRPGPPMMVRSFIAGMLEMLRRVQWNFYRLENEHIGNMDQYRVTREMPLPYIVEEDCGDIDILIGKC